MQKSSIQSQLRFLTTEKSRRHALARFGRRAAARWVGCASDSVMRQLSGPVCVLEFTQNAPERSLVLIEIAPSILSADFARLAEDANEAVRGGATLLHVDVMDGHFVPNITIGPPVVASLRKAVDVPLDCHLMIENPDEFIRAFADAGANWISVHQEGCIHLNRTLELIRSYGARVGVAINPATTVQTLGEVLDIVDFVLVMSVNPGFGGQRFIPGALEKVRKLATMRNARGVDFRIEIDGGID